MARVISFPSYPAERLRHWRPWAAGARPDGRQSPLRGPQGVPRGPQSPRLAAAVLSGGTRRRRVPWDAISLVLAAVAVTAAAAGAGAGVAPAATRLAGLAAFAIRSVLYLRHLSAEDPRALRRAGAGPWGRLLIAGVGLTGMLSGGPHHDPGVQLVVWAVVLHAFEWVCRRSTPRVAGAQSRPAAAVGAATVEADAADAADAAAAAAAPDADVVAVLEAGSVGEAAVSQRLAAELPTGPGGYVILNNLQLPDVAGDIDHVVVGPTGVFVLETKNVAGLIQRREDGSWRRLKVGRRGGVYEAQIGDPHGQVRRNVHALRVYLRRHAADLCARTQFWIEGMVVFPHPAARLERCLTEFPLVYLDEVGPTIRNAHPRRGLLPYEVEHLVALLEAGGAGAGAVQPAEEQLVLAVLGTRGAALGAGGAPGAPSAQREQRYHRQQGEGGQALVETALVLPVLLLLAFALLGAARVTQAQMGVSAVSREAARAGALASSVSDAVAWGTARGLEVAAGYQLTNGSLQLTVDPGDMARGGQVQAGARYELSFDDLPLLSWVHVPVHSSHAELIDPYRSR